MKPLPISSLGAAIPICLFLTLTLTLATGWWPAFAEEGNGEAGYSNSVKWATASETDNFGYYVYRGDTEDGPFERLTEDPIPGAGTTDEMSRYEWIDDTIDPHRAYFYYVEAISMDGSRARFTPVIEAPPKISEESDDGGESDADTGSDE